MLVPPFDFINSRQNFWHDYHWLIQLVMYQIYKNYGYLELICFYSTIFSLTCLTLFKIALNITKEQSQSILIALVASFASCYLLKDVSSVRPQLISFLMISYTCYLLLKPALKLEGLILFLLAIILVNVHVYWIFIPFLYFCYRVIPTLTNYQTKDLVLKNLLILCLISLAGFISPYGIFTNGENFNDYFQNYSLILEYLQTDAFLKKFITEFLGGFQGWEPTSYICFAYLICLVRFVDKKSLSRDLGIHLAGAISLYLLFESVKFSSIFAILALVSWIKILPPISYRPNQKLLVILLISFNLSLTLGVLNRLQSKEKVADDIALFTPSLACSQLASLDLPRKKFQILTEFTYGGWCYWSLFEKGITNFQVTTDGRTQGVPIADYRTSYQIYGVREGWNKSIAEWNPDFILASREVPLAHVLPFFQAEWKNIYIDSGFAMYAKAN